MLVNKRFSPPPQKKSLFTFCGPNNRNLVFHVWNDVSELLKWIVSEMNCVFCWQHYDRSSGAADSNVLDEVKKVMNILYHRLQPQFVPSMSYDGLQIRHIFMATIRVYAQNLFTFLVLVLNGIPRQQIALCGLFLSLSPPTIFVQRIWCKIQCFYSTVYWGAFLDAVLCQWASGSPRFRG